MSEYLQPARAAEHLVCADLLLAGYRAQLSTPDAPYDVIAEAAGRFVLVQVKATLQARPRSGRTLDRCCYQFGINHRRKRRYTEQDAALIAFVALDRRLICYVLTVECPTIMHFDEPDAGGYRDRLGRDHGGCPQFSDFTLATAMQKLGVLPCTL